MRHKDVARKEVVVAPHHRGLQLFRCFTGEIQFLLHGLEVHSIMCLLLGFILIVNVLGHCKPAHIAEYNEHTCYVCTLPRQIVMTQAFSELDNQLRLWW